MDFIRSVAFIADPLSLFFLCVILLVALPSAVYSIGYLKGHCGRGKLLYGTLLLAAFVVSMGLCVTAANLLFFLITWELMSLSSYFLVIFDDRHSKAVEAGALYIIMTHIGTAFITAALFILYTYSGSFDFSACATACQAMPQGLRNLLFIFFFIGFGTKAGLVPMHLWLPYAHPEAPSHVSALMSGVMLKVAVYGMLRFIFMILGPGGAWWGYCVIFFAALSCLVGIVYALTETDIKKLLAYSSVENMGLITLCLGCSAVFTQKGMQFAAFLSLCAGLYHLLNHAVFKSLLFYGAGSVYKGTGTRNIEKMGGLIHRMPVTAACFLAGCLAASAIPPFNGFASEWMMFQAFLYGALHGWGSDTVLMAGCVVILALTGGLAAACFVKAFGIPFLARPRSVKAGEAVEAPASMKAPMVFMAFLALGLGLAAPVAVKAVAAIAGFVLQVPSEGLATTAFSLRPAAGQPALSPALVAGVLLFIAAGVFIFLKNRTQRTRNLTWDCGYYNLDSRTEYTATAFSKPFRIAFHFFLLPYRKTEKVRESFYHVRRFTYETQITPVFRKYFYEPLLSSVYKLAHMVRRIQPGSIHLYIAYIFITILALVIIFVRF